MVSCGAERDLAGVMSVKSVAAVAVAVALVEVVEAEA